LLLFLLLLAVGWASNAALVTERKSPAAESAEMLASGDHAATRALAGRPLP
jgi:hypothetical protein